LVVVLKKSSLGNTHWGRGILKRSSYLPLIVKPDAAESSPKVVSFPEKGNAASTQPWTYIRDGMIGLLSLDIHHLSPAASMTLFTVHHFNEQIPLPHAT
jgi:hypothetical protein